MIDLYRKERAEVLGQYVIDTGATIRSTAQKFGISKSPVHKDLSYKLYKINPTLMEQVRVILEFNKSERHLRGGEATKRKYQMKRESKIK